MTTNNDKNAVGGWGGFVYFRASLRPAQAGTAFRGGVFARPAQAGTDAYNHKMYLYILFANCGFHGGEKKAVQVMFIC